MICIQIKLFVYKWTSKTKETSKLKSCKFQKGIGIERHIQDTQ